MRIIAATLLLLITAAVVPCLAADAPAPAADSDDPEAIQLQTITMKDGRKLVGTYDEKKHIVTMINAKTGKVTGHVLINPADIVSTEAMKAVKRAPVVKPGTDGHFIENYAEAVALAKATHRPILMDFTGSDWCPWCIKLHDEVFASPAFVTWAAAHVVVFEADFPNEKPQDAATKKQNQELQATWGIRGYPTVIVCDAAGAKLAQSGYFAGGPEHWIADLEQRMGTDKK